MTWGTRGLARLAASSPEDRLVKSMTTIRSYPLEQFSKSGRLTQNLAWFTVVACSFVFFLCFATSQSFLPHRMEKLVCDPGEADR